MNSFYRGKFLAMVGFALVVCFAGAVTREVSSVVSDALLGLAGILGIGSVVIFFKGMRSKYDLATLRELHELEAAQNRERDQASEFDSVYCMRCGEAFNTRFSVCPNCGRSLS